MRALLLLSLVACTASSNGGQKDAGVEPSDGGDALTPTDSAEPAADTTAPDVQATPDVPEVDLFEPEPDLVEPEPDIPVVVDEDQDDDGIPDGDDPYPSNGDMPGVVLKGKVYAHTDDQLFTMDVKTYKITEVAPVTFDLTVDNNDVTDIAIDRYGVLTAVSYDELWRCHPGTAECQSVGTLPASFNALSWVPAGTIDPSNDVLIGVAGGDWFRLDAQDATTYTATKIGNYGGGYQSSGDVYSLLGVGTYASVNGLGVFSGDDMLVEVNPLTGQVVAEIGPLTGYGSVFGIAGWTSRAFAFDSSGAILVVDVKDGTIVKTIEDTGHKWWGAGVPTVVADE